MTEPRDPIDDWLSADVELLRPPPGAFERIHHRARRRKAIRAVSTAAGAAVLIAAAVTLPQVAAGLLPSGGGPNKVGTGKSSTATSPGTHHPSSSPPASSSPTSPPALGGGSALGTLRPTRPAAPGFRPTSVTFVGTPTGTLAGAALGHAGCPSGSCTSVAGTNNYGRTWYQVGAPPAGPTAVSQIRFSDTSNGWAYGPEFYVTHDGGLRWKKITGLPGRVLDLSTIGGRAFAVIGTSCTGRAATSCASIALWSARTQSDTWRPVPGSSTSISEVQGGLQLTGQYGFLMTKGRLYAGPLTGGRWQAVSNAARSVPPCLVSALVGPWLLAPGAPDVFLACAGSSGSLALYRSADHGLTWREEGPVAASGTATSMAVAPTSGSLVLATSTGIYYSTDQRTWHPAHVLPQRPAGGFGYIGMTTSKLGVAVPVDSGLGEIFVTHDGGRTWHSTVIG
jgi:hypothetical protein